HEPKAGPIPVVKVKGPNRLYGLIPWIKSEEVFAAPVQSIKYHFLWTPHYGAPLVAAQCAKRRRFADRVSGMLLWHLLFFIEIDSQLRAASSFSIKVTSL